jgi:NAD(P)-dependent dehydrogenase (short-subunit alcohol dehydrogenase family)
VVVGATGGVGSAIFDLLSRDSTYASVLPTSRSRESRGGTPYVYLDVTDEASIARAAERCRRRDGLDLVIVASGILHDVPAWGPEKSWSDIDPDNLARSFAVNCTGPALVAKHFLPLLATDRRAVFAALAARVGSIGDNRLGGWYAYRASKAALAMTIRTLAIELRRKAPEAICIGLHPGTVDTHLSGPFQSRVPEGRLFEPRFAAQKLLQVVAGAQPEDSGNVIAWDGQTIAP